MIKLGMRVINNWSEDSGNVPSMFGARVMKFIDVPFYPHTDAYYFGFLLCLSVKFLVQLGTSI